MPKRESRISAWRARLSERLARSSRIFLLGLMVACGVEVVVDWNGTLFEINVLRDQIHQKGGNYAGLLQKITVEPMLIGDVATLDHLSAGIIDDEDAVFVRITDENGKIIFDRVDPSYEKAYERRGKGTFRNHYDHWLDRDVRGVLDDPELFKQRLATSRYRDLPQIWTDTTARIVGVFIPPQPVPASRSRIVYQDRLRDENHRRDDTISWAIAPLESHGKKVGAVLVAFDMTRINQAVRAKYIKGLGMIAFFVGLSLVQNIIGRRDKLRLLDLEVRYTGAKRALRAAFPSGPVAAGELSAYGAIEQAKGCVDGLVFDLSARNGVLEVFVIDPDGDGIDAAAVGLHELRTIRARRQALPTGEPSPPIVEEILALGAATHGIPLARPIAILLLRVEPSGNFTAVMSDFANLHLLDGSTSTAVPTQPLTAELPTGMPDGVPDGVIGPLHRCGGTIPQGAMLLCACADPTANDVHIDSDALAKYLLRSRVRVNPSIPSAEDAAIWARGKNSSLGEKDIAVVLIRRAEAAGIT
jgi:hypothetical protein